MTLIVLAEGTEWTLTEIVRLCEEEPKLSSNLFIAAMGHALQRVFSPLVGRLLWNAAEGRLTCFAQLEPDPGLIDAIRVALAPGFVGEAIAQAKKRELRRM